MLLFSSLPLFLHYFCSVIIFQGPRSFFPLLFFHDFCFMKPHFFSTLFFLFAWTSALLLQFNMLLLYLPSSCKILLEYKSKTEAEQVLLKGRKWRDCARCACSIWWCPCCLVEPEKHREEQVEPAVFISALTSSFFSLLVKTEQKQKWMSINKSSKLVLVWAGCLISIPIPEANKILFGNENSTS